MLRATPCVNVDVRDAPHESLAAWQGTLQRAHQHHPLAIYRVPPCEVFIAPSEDVLMGTTNSGSCCVVETDSVFREQCEDVFADQVFWLTCHSVRFWALIDAAVLCAT